MPGAAGIVSLPVTGRGPAHGTQKVNTFTFGLEDFCSVSTGFRGTLARRALRCGGAVPQMIVVSSPPLFIGREVRRFCVETGARYVVDIMDAWPETFERVVPRWALGWMRRLARNNYVNASAITAVARRYLDLAKSYGAECPMHLCYHGIEFEGKGKLP